MSHFEQLESLRKTIVPGAKWRRRRHPDRIFTIRDVCLDVHTLRPMIIYEYSRYQDVLLICEPGVWFQCYEECFELLGDVRPTMNKNNE